MNVHFKLKEYLFFIKVIIMKPPINDKCDFTNSTTSCRNFVKGQRVLNTDHIIFCDRKSVSNDCIYLIGFYLQMSNLKEIIGSISAAGKILHVKCFLKVGLR